jgi:Leucine-rich repeat (LRR) protein
VEGNPLNILEIDVLKNRNVRVLEYYDIMMGENEYDLLFAIPHLNSPVVEGYTPRLYYDGGQHAIFLKNDELVVICDHLHPGVRGSLDRVKEVQLAEMSDNVIVEEYDVDVQFHPLVDEIAESLMNKPEPDMTPIHFPDLAFEQAVRKIIVKLEGDITKDDVAGITKLGLGRLDISDLSGIEHFAALKTLDVQGNNMSKLDLSHNTALEKLNCTDNELADLDLSNNKSLTELLCKKNKFHGKWAIIGINLERLREFEF